MKLLKVADFNSKVKVILKTMKDTSKFARKIFRNPGILSVRKSGNLVLWCLKYVQVSSFVFSWNRYLLHWCFTVVSVLSVFYKKRRFVCCVGLQSKRTRKLHFGSIGDRRIVKHAYYGFELSHCYFVVLWDFSFVYVFKCSIDGMCGVKQWLPITLIMCYSVRH